MDRVLVCEASDVGSTPAGDIALRGTINGENFVPKHNDVPQIPLWQELIVVFGLAGLTVGAMVKIVSVICE